MGGVDSKLHRRVAEQRDEIATLQLIGLHSVPVS
jgi:hypothetical protein